MEHHSVTQAIVNIPDPLERLNEAIAPITADPELEDDSSVDMATASSKDNIVVHTSKLDGRKRQIEATVEIPHSVEQVWSILTDYERLAEFIPSLKKSQRLEHPQKGIRIEQIGSESLLKVKFCARVVLDMVETFPHCLSFEMVEGDFKMFCGEWQLQPLADNTATSLTYTLRVWPSRLMPVGMIEKRLAKGLQVNLIAIKQQANALFGQK